MRPCGYRGTLPLHAVLLPCSAWDVMVRVEALFEWDLMLGAPLENQRIPITKGNNFLHIPKQ